MRAIDPDRRKDLRERPLLERPRQFSGYKSNGVSRAIDKVARQ
jgi:hypothetical protein